MNEQAIQYYARKFFGHLLPIFSRLSIVAILEQRRRKVHFANTKVEFTGIDTAEENAEATFINELSVDGDGWAQLAPFGDYPGKAMEKQTDGTVKTFRALQRFDHEAADGMVQRFKSPFQRVKRYFTGCPIFNGHPDAAAGGNRFPDKTTKGMIVDLAVRDDGLYCKPVFTNEGSALVETKKVRALSGLWSADEIGEETRAGNVVKIYRPDLLKSAGLTNTPNLPVQLMNVAETTTETTNTTKTKMKKITAWLSKQGITIANEATEDQVEAALAQLEPKITSATTFANEANSLKNEKASLTGIVTAKDGIITQLTTERDSLKTSFANERKARIAGLLDTAVTDGRITAADRATWETRLAVETSFANEAEAIIKLAKKVKTESIIVDIGARKATIANSQDRQEAVRDLVALEIANTKCDYDTAFGRVRKANPALFDAMKQPAKN